MHTRFNIVWGGRNEQRRCNGATARREYTARAHRPVRLFQRRRETSVFANTCRRVWIVIGEEAASLSLEARRHAKYHTARNAAGLKRAFCKHMTYCKVYARVPLTALGVGGRAGPMAAHAGGVECSRLRI